jgi:microcystin-dependent protein
MPSEVSDTVVFRWTPDKTANEDNVTVNGTAGTLSIVGKTISFTLENGTIMANHTPEVSYNQTTGGASRVTTSITNNKLYITITGKRVVDTDTWPSVTKLHESLNNLTGISGASGGSEDLNPNPPDTSDTNIIASGKRKTFTISGITPNAMPGFVTIFIEYQGIVGYPSGKLNVAVSKVSKDIAQLVGGGNVGIGTGTTNPEAKLQVNGSVMIGGPDHVATQLRITSQNRAGGAPASTSTILMEGHSSRGQGIYFKEIDHPQKQWFAGINYFTSFDTYSIGYDATGGHLVQHEEKSLLTVRGSNGNVGIGTTIPEHKLQVNGNVNTTGKLKEDGHDLIPVGTIVMWSGSTAPDGWALCNGSGEYTDMNGDEQDVPDLRNRFVLGYNSSSRPIGARGGEENVTLTIAQMPRHNHTATDSGHSHGLGPITGNNEIAGGGGFGTNYGINRSDRTSYLGHAQITIGETGEDQAHSNMPPFYVLAYIIKL